MHWIGPSNMAMNDFIFQEKKLGPVLFWDCASWLIIQIIIILAIKDCEWTAKGRFIRFLSSWAKWRNSSFGGFIFTVSVHVIILSNLQALPSVLAEVLSIIHAGDQFFARDFDLNNLWTHQIALLRKRNYQQLFRVVLINIGLIIIPSHPQSWLNWMAR